MSNANTLPPPPALDVAALYRRLRSVPRVVDEIRAAASAPGSTLAEVYKTVSRPTVTRWLDESGVDRVGLHRVGRARTRVEVGLAPETAAALERLRESRGTLAVSSAVALGVAAMLAQGDREEDGGTRPDAGIFDDLAESGAATTGGVDLWPRALGRTAARKLALRGPRIDDLPASGTRGRGRSRASAAHEATRREGPVAALRFVLPREGAPHARARYGSEAAALRDAEKTETDAPRVLVGIASGGHGVADLDALTRFAEGWTSRGRSPRPPIEVEALAEAPEGERVVDRRDAFHPSGRVDDRLAGALDARLKREAKARPKAGGEGKVEKGATP